MVTVKQGGQADLPGVLALIQELAEFERAGDQVQTSVESMRQDAFGDRPVFDFYVAVKDSDESYVGLALFFYSYSTWKGKCLYLEDLVVTQAHRGKGLGRRLLDTVMQVRCISKCPSAQGLQLCSAALCCNLWRHKFTEIGLQPSCALTGLQCRRANVHP